MLLLFLLAIILIAVIIFNTQSSENFDDRSSLDIYYRKKFVQKPDACGDCAGLCQSCNIGKNIPNTCHNLTPFGEMKLSFCQNIKDIDKFEYVYISSMSFNKNLAFETYGNHSNLYLEPNNLQKWKLEMVNPKTCTFMIYSYSQPHYYLYADENGKLDMSLFRGGLNQYWQLIPYCSGKKTAFVIRSTKYCILLGGTNEGYLEKNTGKVYLTNEMDSHVFWYLMKGDPKNPDFIPQGPCHMEK